MLLVNMVACSLILTSRDKDHCIKRLRLDFTRLLKGGLAPS